ncbi:LacI family DNA-binding transcriptional regulator [Glutamicibacter soli]
MSEARKQQPTLELVAERAGVSRATVSRVVNGSEKVKPEAMRAVEQAIRELNYVPNRAARSLAQGRTNAIALVVPENTAKFFADPYFAKVVQGAAQYLADTEFMLSLLLSTESDPGKPHAICAAAMWTAPWCCPTTPPTVPTRISAGSSRWCSAAEP